MLKRREFLKHSALVATVASTGILAARADEPRRPIHFVLVDDELEDSISFADALIAQGARAFSVQEDIGRLWFGELGEAFERGHAIAGLTSHTELLVCKAFTHPYGARVRFEGSHDCRGSDVLTHSLRIAVTDSPLSERLAQADGHWPRVLASHLTTLSPCDALHDECCRSMTRRSASHPGSLFSWVIA